jgi:hypothetical protein
MSEQDASGGKAIEVWRLREAGTPASGRLQTGIATKAVSTCGVERDQEDVGVL